MKAPFPWFGGKSRVAPIVWDFLGDPINYVEPFAGSLAVLLGRPSEPRVETVNDLDCLIPNFWRAIQHDPQQVAHWADYPVIEADLHARHTWLVERVWSDAWRESMKTNPDFYDAKVAGWWVWGISMWIGSGWCSQPGWRGRAAAHRAPRGVHQKRPRLASGGRGVAGRVWQQRPFLKGMGVHQKRPRLASGGRGVAGRVWEQLPSLKGSHGAVSEANAELEGGGIYGWFDALSSRLRRVRVCCGDWSRVLGPSPTTCVGTTGVFLDPPYAVADRADVYGEESRDVAHLVREWALEHGSDPQLRIALCGYEGEHAMPGEWHCVKWKAQGGYANNGESNGANNAKRERIWFSPHCLIHPRLDFG